MSAGVVSTSATASSPPDGRLAEIDGGGRVAGHAEVASAPFRFEPRFDGALDLGHEAFVVAVRIQQNEQALVQAQLSEGEDFREFLEGAIAARECDEGLCAGVHCSFSFAHVVYDSQFVETGMVHLGVDELPRDDPLHTAALAERRQVHAARARGG